MSKKEKQTGEKFPFAKFLAWKSRDISLACVTVIISGYFMMFCSDNLGVDLKIVGVLLMASKAFDGVTDLFAGYIVDNTNTKLGKGRPYEFFIILDWAATVLLFFASPEWSNTAKYIWIFVMYTFIFSICGTMLNGNQTPYMVRAFRNNRNIITKVSSFGGIVSMMGSIIVSILFPRVMAQLVTNPIKEGGTGDWRTLIMIFAVPLALIGILRFIFVKEDDSIDAGKTAQKIDLKEIGTMLKTNKYAWFFAGMIGTYNLVYSLGAGSYYFTYIVGNIEAFGIVSAFGIMLLPVMLIFPKLIKKYDVATLFIVFSLLSAGGYLMVFLGGSNLSMVYIGIVITNLISLPSSYLQVLCIMDLSTYNEYNGLHRMEGTTGVVSGFASKVLGGVGTGLTGILLSMAGYVSSNGSTVVEQPESALFMIRVCYSLLPMALMLVIAFFSIKFSKLSKKMPEIEAELAARKEAAAEA